MTLSTCFTEDNVDFMNQLGITQSELIQCQIEEVIIYQVTAIS